MVNLSLFGLSAIATISLILLALVLFKVIKVGKNWKIVAVVLAGVFLFTGGGTLLGLGKLGLGASGSGLTTVGGGGTDTVITQDGVSVICQQPGGGNTNTLNVVVRNPNAASLTYLANTLSFDDDEGTTLATGTANSGGALSYRALSSTPCRVGKLTALGSTTVTGAQIPADSLKLSQEYTMLAANGSQIGVDILTRTYGDNMDYAGGTQTGATSGASTVQALAINTKFEFILRFGANQTATGQFGSRDGAFWISADTTALTEYNPTDFLTLTSGTGGFTLTEQTCPNTLATKNSADKCWRANKPLKQSDGTIELLGSLIASTADPTTNVTVYWDDEDYFRDTDGKIKFGLANGASADIGNTRTQMILSVN